MPSNDIKIQPLPADVVAKLKSSTSIVHLNGVIAELVKNALDANADSVLVTVDFQRGGCVVEDDGDGIPCAEFEPGGGLGKPHHTSKFNSEATFHGRRGLFLASLSSLSLLTVTSHQQHQKANTVIFHHSTPVARMIPAPVQHGLNFSHGTSITVNDLFGNMPVRVKSRALALQKPDELEREWDDLKQVLVPFMLATDGLSKLVLADASKCRKLTIRPRRQPPPGLRTDELDLQRISSVLAQAGLVNFGDYGSWNAVSARVPNFSIHAAISLTPSPTKKVQFISLGMCPLFPHNNANVLYSEVNRLFASSDFRTMGAPGLPVVNAEGQTGASGSSKAMAKGVNKWPMFYIRVETSATQNLYDDGHEISPESDKSIQRIMDVLGAMIHEFLKQNNLRPRAGKRKREPSKSSEEAGAGDSSGTRKTRSATRQEQSGEPPSTEETLGTRLKLPSFQRSALKNPYQDLGNWSRIKSAKEPARGARSPVKVRDSNSKESNRLSVAGHDKSLEIRSPAPGSAVSLQNSIDADAEAEWATSQPNAQDAESDLSTDRMIPWKDPCTGRAHLVNSRTGQSMHFRSPMDAALDGKRSQSTGSIPTGQALASVTRPKSTLTSTTQNLWVENLLKRWNNPAFSRTEKPIDSLDVTADHDSELDKLAFKAHACLGETSGLERFGLAKFRGKLHRQDLKTAEVVAQVDQKFILVKLRSQALTHEGDSGSILALIDQHAADERCRVERLFEEFFVADGEQGIRTVRVEPIIFEVPATETPLLKKGTEFLSSWGIRYDIEQPPASRAALVSVYSLPTLIAERCRLEPHLVTDLIRGEIWKRAENGHGHLRSRPEDSFLVQSEPDSWVKRLGDCPRGIIDLLNSRACRTAIMFNDVLTVDECQNLVSRLARCVFPFQCAHGRPSMVPVLDMQSLDRFDYPMSEYEMVGRGDFGEAFKKRYIDIDCTGSE